MTHGENSNEWYHYYCSGFYVFKFDARCTFSRTDGLNKIFNQVKVSRFFPKSLGQKVDLVDSDETISNFSKYQEYNIDSHSFR